MTFASSTAGRTVGCGLIFFGYRDVVMLLTTCFKRATAVSWPPGCRKWLRPRAGVIFSGLQQTFYTTAGATSKFQRRLAQWINLVMMTRRRGSTCAAVLSD